MIQLTPLEETVAVKELIQMGMEKGREEGELIGKIQMAQRFLKRPIMPKESLVEQGVESLRTLLEQLEAELE